MANRANLKTCLYGAACISLQPLLLNVISIPVMAYIIRCLGAEGYGQWAMATSLIAIAMIVTNLGLRGAFVRAVARRPDRAHEALAEQLGVRLGLSCAGAAIAVACCLLLRYPPVVLLCTIISVAGIFIASFGSTLIDLMQAMHRLPLISAANLAAGLVLTAASLLAVVTGGGPIAVAGAYLSGPLTLSIILLLVVRRQHFPVRIRWDLRRFLTLIRGSRFFAAQQALHAAAAHADALLLPRLVGSAHFGFYSAGSLVASRLSAVPDGLCTAVYPAIAQAHQRSRTEGARLAIKYLGLTLAICLLIALAGTMLADPIARLLFPVHPEVCATVMLITIWAIPLLGLESVMGYALNAAGQDAAMARASVPAAVCNVTLTMGLVMGFGLIGACWAVPLRHAVRSLFLTGSFVRTFGPEMLAPQPLAALNSGQQR